MPTSLLAHPQVPTERSYDPSLPGVVAGFWPNNVTAVAVYDSGTRWPITALALRARFGNAGDLHGIGSMPGAKHETLGEMRCESLGILVTCGRESEHMSVSVTVMRVATSTQVAAMADELWADLT